MHKVYAIVISFSPNIDLLDQEYKSIVNQVAGIIYIDNGSKNVSAIRNWRKEKNCDFIFLGKNYGIGKAQNEGIRKALSNGATHILILDQDSILPNNFVNGLMEVEKEAMSSGINVGITGPIYKTIDESYTYPITSIQNNKFRAIPLNNFDHFIEVSHVISSGSLIRSEVFRNVGLLNEELFVGYVDFEFCFRALSKGYRIIVTKDVCMKHNIGDRRIKLFGHEIGIYSPFRRYFECRNVLLIQHMEFLPKVFRIHYLKLIFPKFVISLLYGPNRFKQLQYCLRGFYDGIKGVSGECTIHS